MKSKRITRLIGALVAVFLLWIIIDLFVPRHADFRRFDPNEVAHLDAVMWRSYYERKHRQLFFQLAELLRRQLHFPFLRSHEAAVHAGRAAFAFKDGHNLADYSRALPDLVKYFQSIRAISARPFDARRAAELELEWWIVHRERSSHVDGDLARALAEAAAELYSVPPDNLMEYGRLRADAMNIRDDKAAAGGVTPADWRNIETELRAAWQSLWKAVQRT
jgi:hypothetical protein